MKNLFQKMLRTDYVSLMKVSFDVYEMNIDLSKFNNVNLNEENITTSYRMKKIDQLRISIDTLETSFKEKQNIFYNNFSKNSFSLVKEK